jgi:AcrR family transcriptional regulator
MTLAPTARAPRADAERNRRRILDAAAEVFAERGVSATLNDVARAAGVGVGTVYRKFADKDAMLDELFADKIDTLVRLAEESSADGEPGAAFRGFLLSLMQTRATDRGLDAILSAPGRSARFTDELGRRFMPEVDRLVSRAIAAGELRAGFSGQEVCLLAFMVGKVADITRASDPDVWRRYAQLLIDGTRPSAATEPLAPGALAFDDMAAALGRAG